MDVLQNFLRDRQIRSVVDLGCGDWQFSQYIDWSGIQYTGVDLVPSVVEQNQARFAKSNVRFQLYDGDFSRLPRADLLIAKDVLQHWSNKTVHEFLPTLQRYPYSLITNCINPRGPTRNIDIPDGGYRYLDLRLPPFN